ncbi:MAG: hypothetical protein ACO266_00775 [Steroidobacteraceae bacterium]
MNTCPAIPGSSATASTLTAGLTAVALTMLLFWGLGHSSEHLQPPRAAPVATSLAT